jgi:hypothetical protein
MSQPGTKTQAQQRIRSQRNSLRQHDSVSHRRECARENILIPANARSEKTITFFIRKTFYERTNSRVEND